MGGAVGDIVEVGSLGLIDGDSISGAGAGRDAARASTQAARIQAQSQREALEYLKEREAIPQQFREGALQVLGGLYGLEGGEGSQQELIDAAKASPLYGAIMGGLEASEDAIIRNAGATGGLRSGNVQQALADNAEQLQNRALLSSYNEQLGGIRGLAGLESNANQIAQQISGIGQTLGQGQVAAANARMQAEQNATNNLLGLGGLGLGAVAAFSDVRLKRDIQPLGQRNGLNWYEWTWSDEAESLGLTGKMQGVMAHEIIEEHPDAILTDGDYLLVDYSKLGVH